MLTDLADGVIDGVLVYHIDRLTRRPIELEQFLAVVDSAKVRHVRFVTGDTDLNTGDGLLVARMLAAVAANESASKSRRIRRKMEQLAAEGRPHAGANRPFGYQADKVSIEPAEAEVFRTLVARFLAGESTISLTRWLQAEGIKSVYGMDWRTSTLRTMLANPRYAGLRTHRGQVIGPATWDGLIDEETHRKVVAKMAEKAASGRRTPQRYLLSGLLTCGKCGNRLYSSARKTTRRYVCSSNPDHRGCGRLTVVADPLERLVADAVPYRLDGPAIADAGRTRQHRRTQQGPDTDRRYRPGAAGRTGTGLRQPEHHDAGVDDRP
jgi:site-specific DNA recombinase